MKFDSP